MRFLDIWSLKHTQKPTLIFAHSQKRNQIWCMFVKMNESSLTYELDGGSYQPKHVSMRKTFYIGLNVMQAFSDRFDSWQTWHKHQNLKYFTKYIFINTYIYSTYIYSTYISTFKIHTYLLIVNEISLLTSFLLCMT